MSKTEDLYSQILSSDSKHICLIAAPGSGKTSRALIPKVQQILAKPGVDPKNVLILSFSRLSAADLKKRLVQPVREHPRCIHSACPYCSPRTITRLESALAQLSLILSGTR